MNNAIKMVRLDVLSTMKTYTAMFLVVFLAIAVFMYPNLSVMGVSCAWIVSVLSAMVFMAQEKNDLTRLYASFPILKRDIVLGRFLYTVGFFLLVFAIAAALYVVISLFTGTPVQPLYYAMGFAVSFLVFSIIVGAQMPFFFKMGYMKGRALSIVIFLALIGLNWLATFYLGFEDLTFLAAQSVVSVLVLMALSLVILVVSYLVSVRVYPKN